MKFQSVLGRLNRFGFTVDEKGHHYFWTRNEAFKNRIIQVINQDGRAVALPMIIQPDGQQKVVFSAKTIKSLVDFLEGK